MWRSGPEAHGSSMTLSAKRFTLCDDAALQARIIPNQAACGWLPWIAEASRSKRTIETLPLPASIWAI